MAKLAIWIEAAMNVMEQNLQIVRECYERKQIDLMIRQLMVFRKHIDSFIDFLEKRKVEGV